MQIRLAAIDFGKRRIGLAISDPNQSLSLPLSTFYVKPNTSEQKIIEGILDQLKTYEIEAVIIGHPIEMKGNIGKMAKEVQEFALHFEKISSLKTILWDERLSSKQADQTLRHENIKRKKRDALNDSLAASLLLQSYLDYLAYKN